MVYGVPDQRNDNNKGCCKWFGTLIVPYSVKPIIMPKSQEIWKRLQISAKSQAKDEVFMPVKYELLKRKNPKKATEKT